MITAKLFSHPSGVVRILLLVAGLFLAIPIFWKSVQPSPQPILDCAAQASAPDSSAPVQSRCGLGRKWEVNEGCWRGVYVRRGDSNIFDAEWTLLDGRRFTAEVTIDIQGSRVFVQRRRATLQGDCDLVNGTLSGDGLTVTGVYQCSPSQGTGCFFARIVCDDDSSSGPACGLGTRWDGTEQGWTQTLTRRGNSNVFDVRATKPGLPPLTAVETIDIQGNKVFRHRTWTSDGNTCELEGTIAADRVTITGTYRCRSGGPYSWQARIRCD